MNPAELAVYKAAGCLESDILASISGIYQDDYGKPVDGQDNIYQRWVKNIGDYTAPAVSVKDISDPRGYVQYSSNGVTWADVASIGDILAGQIKTFYIRIAFPYGATEAYDVQAYYELSNY